MNLFRKNKRRKISTEFGKKYLQLGCGKDIRAGWVNCDIQSSPNIDFSFDFEKFPYPFEDNQFDYIFIDNVLEHMLYPLLVIDELYRISNDKSVIHIVVPYFNCAGAYNDVTHHHYFNRRTFENIFNPNSGYKLENDNKFKIISLKLEPTLAGKFVPSFMRELLSMFIGGIIGSIECKVKVIK